jgi:hypothetical protein
MAQRVTVRERIDPAITASLFANYRSSADAVMELVDNARSVYRFCLWATMRRSQAMSSVPATELR